MPGLRRVQVQEDCGHVRMAAPATPHPLMLSISGSLALHLPVLGLHQQLHLLRLHLLLLVVVTHPLLPVVTHLLVAEEVKRWPLQLLSTARLAAHLQQSLLKLLPSTHAVRPPPDRLPFPHLLLSPLLAHPLRYPYLVIPLPSSLHHHSRVIVSRSHHKLQFLWLVVTTNACQRPNWTASCSL